jgi:hypothetical protein
MSGVRILVCSACGAAPESFAVAEPAGVDPTPEGRERGGHANGSLACPICASRERDRLAALISPVFASGLFGDARIRLDDPGPLPDAANKLVLRTESILPAPWISMFGLVPDVEIWVVGGRVTADGDRDEVRQIDEIRAALITVVPQLLAKVVQSHREQAAQLTIQINKHRARADTWRGRYRGLRSRTSVRIIVKVNELSSRWSRRDRHPAGRS